ncbi:alginate export family protein [Shewanella sp. D64]|uniref:alginate export family protein n=1 Tax=unclassified Shewanella TaxID=196818 RepID=UPI0022BA70A3|nr:MULTISPECIES: alginate export family protein [unclassified Shewanella]MEC4727027.1 alginate export family protein [Shewanella sp. D64]MEC4737766.1 alginate export family protein [Shewanella sp. E94]WBJ93974.1 alginate export family protein [Shewanella sp. MTB7]
MKVRALTLAILASISASAIAADTVDPLKKAFIDDAEVNLQFRLRYEQADVENVDDQNQTTLRTRLTYKTGDIYNFFGLTEIDDVRSTDNEPLIADYEYTQINQAFIGYRAPANTLLKYGRQRILLDNQRFVGGVGFRQNEQTYDAFSIQNTAIEHLTAYYAYINNVNRIFSEDSGNDKHKNETNLLNINYKGLDFVHLSGYAYLIDNLDVAKFSTDTYGIRATGNVKLDTLKFNYEAEYAQQSEGGDNPTTYTANYYKLGAGIGYQGFGAKIGYEVLGSDDGKAGFITPLATLHAFNGWTDKFLFGGAGNWDNGLVDTHVILTAKVSGLNLLAKYHKFDSDYGDIDMGQEWGVSASYTFANHYDVSVKYASYTGGDSHIGYSNADTDKIWLTLEAKY